MDAILDRMSMVPGEDYQASTGEPFVPASTWQGSRPGYFFGTGSQGTGYYLDTKNDNANNVEDSTTKRKRTVRINEDNNEMRLLPSKKKVNLLEQAEKEASGSTIIELTPKGLQSASNALSKIFNQNAMQRAQFADQPRQYMDSELALYEQVTALQAIAAEGGKLYQHLVDNETLLSILIELLSHENTDICASVIALFLEWIDPTLLADDPDLISTISVLASKVLEDGWETIVSNLLRFRQQSSNEGSAVDQDDSPDQSLRGIDNTLSLMENLLELDLLIPDGLLGAGNDLSVAAFMAKETKIVSWFFRMIESHDTTEEMMGRFFELLAFISQREDVHNVLQDWSQLSPALLEDDDDKPKKKKQKQEPIQGIEILLQSIGAFRKKQPANDGEVELLENACIILSSCITFSERNLEAFLEGQGIELVVRCLKERVHAGGSGLKLLDFFGSQDIHKEASERLVKAGGFKYIFPIFLNSRIPKPAPSQAKTVKAKREWLHSIETQAIRILYALSFHLDDNSPEDSRARFLTKFVEDDRKCDRLVELLLSYDEKARKAEYNFYRSDVEEEVGEEETVQLAALEAKLKGGGDLFHRLGAIAACVCVQSKRCHERILSQLHLQQSGISLVRTAVDEFISVLGDGPQKQKLDSYLEKF